MSRRRKKTDFPTNEQPAKRRKLNNVPSISATDFFDALNSNSNSNDQKENDIIYPTKLDDKEIDCYSKKKGTCNICFDNNKYLVTISSKCCHPPQYCLECIKKSIESNITGKGLCKFTCDYLNCSHEYSPQIYYPLLSSRNLDIVSNLLLHKVLEDNIDFRWCKNPNGCGSGQEVSNWRDLRGYYCCNSCKQQMCFQHEIIWHNGFTCDEYAKEIKLHPDIATDAVLSSFTKKCPTCHTSIEKAEGCDVMACCQFGTHGCSQNKNEFGKCDHGGKPFCGQTFCWKCLGKIDKVKKGTHYAYQRHCKPSCQYASLN